MNDNEAALTSAEQNQLLFMKWLATVHPAIYNAYITKGSVNAELSGIFDSIGGAISGAGSFITGLLNKAPDILSQYVAGKQQVDLIKVNLERAKQGQPPVNADGTPVQPTKVIGELPATATGQPAPVPSGLGAVSPFAWVALGIAALFLLGGRR